MITLKYARCYYNPGLMQLYIFSGCAGGSINPGYIRSINPGYIHCINVYCGVIRVTLVFIVAYRVARNKRALCVYSGVIIAANIALITLYSEPALSPAQSTLSSQLPYA